MGINNLKKIEINSNLKNADDIPALVCRLHQELNAYNSLKLELMEGIKKNGYFIVNNFGVDKTDLLKLVSLLTNRVYYSKRMGCVIYESAISPFVNSDRITEFSDYGCFHTDFCAQEWADIPDYVAIQCVEPDPKHPLFGLSSIASINSIFNGIERIHPGFINHCLGLEIPHVFSNGIVKNIKFLDIDTNGNLIIRIHTFYVAEELLKDEHYINGVPIHKLIQAMASQLADIFSLGAGDILIFCNKKYLHKRGECTVHFRSSINDYSSRRIRSLRFLDAI